MEARRVPHDAQGAAGGGSFSAPSTEGAVARPAQVRSVDTAASRPSADRPRVRSINSAPSVRESAPKVASPRTPDAMPTGEVKVTLPDAPADAADQAPQNVDVPASVTVRARSRTSSRPGSSARRVALAGAAAAGIMSVAGCGGEEPAPTPTLDALTASCYRPTVPEGMTRTEFVLNQEGVTNADERLALAEQVQGEADEWSFAEGRSTPDNDMGAVVWQCRPGSIYETKPGTNRQPVKPADLQAQDPTAYDNWPAPIVDTAPRSG